MTGTKPVRYPWEEWFSRSKLRLIQGKHYNCQPHSMGQQVRNAAAKFGCTVSVFIDGGTLQVHVLNGKD